jgi:hypothetical protein
VEYETAKSIEFFVFFTLIFGVGFYQLYQLRRLEKQRETRAAQAEAQGEAAPATLSHIPGWMLRR